MNPWYCYSGRRFILESALAAVLSFIPGVVSVGRGAEEDTSILGRF